MATKRDTWGTAQKSVYQRVQLRNSARLSQLGIGSYTWSQIKQSKIRRACSDRDQVANKDSQLALHRMVFNNEYVRATIFMDFSRFGVGLLDPIEPRNSSGEAVLDNRLSEQQRSSIMPSDMRLEE